MSALGFAGRSSLVSGWALVRGDLAWKLLLLTILWQTSVIRKLIPLDVDFLVTFFLQSGQLIEPRRETDHGEKTYRNSHFDSLSIAMPWLGCNTRGPEKSVGRLYSLAFQPWEGGRAPQGMHLPETINSFHRLPSAIALEDAKVCVSCSVVSDSLQPYGLYPNRLLCPWNSPGKNTGVDSLSFFQGIFLTQGSNLGLLHCRQILYRLSHQGSLASGFASPTVGLEWEKESDANSSSLEVCQFVLEGRGGKKKQREKNGGGCAEFSELFHEVGALSCWRREGYAERVRLVKKILKTGKST